MTSEVTSLDDQPDEPPAAAPHLKRPKRLSPSGASAFQQCPKKWRRRYIEHLADPPGEAALVGSFAHRVLELLMQLGSADRTKESARDIATREWPKWEAGADFKALELDDEATRGFKWKSWNAVANLWQLQAPTDIEVKATEQNVQATLAGVPFRGIVDRLDVEDHRLVVTDYKSGSAPRLAKYRNEKLPQVLLYAAAIADASGEMPARARLLFLGERTEEVSAEVTETRLEEVTGALGDTWSEIDKACTNDDFPTKVGPLCGWCPYIEMCPDGQAEVSKRRRGRSSSGRG